MIKATDLRKKEKLEMSRNNSFKNSVSVGVGVNQSRWFEKKSSVLLDSNLLLNIPDIYEMKEGAEGYWEKRNKRDWINVNAHYV